MIAFKYRNNGTSVFLFLIVVFGITHVQLSAPKTSSISHYETNLKIKPKSKFFNNMEQDQRKSDGGKIQISRIKRSDSSVYSKKYLKTGPNQVSMKWDHLKGMGDYFEYERDVSADMQGNMSNSVLTPDLRLPKSLYEKDKTVSNSEINIESSPTSNPTTVSTNTQMLNKGRQNSDHDIKDIITGIVKLLNGNVNVHTNTQLHRRPIASRINNRGPPRISETQGLALDYDQHKPTLGSSMRPPPYPFDYPERPFITGVPIPEQIVPYRPGFVSNRPPWHRNRPRPPIITNDISRRPIILYKPIQTQHNPQQNFESTSDQEPLLFPSSTSTQYADEVKKLNGTLSSAKDEFSFISKNNTNIYDLQNTGEILNTEQYKFSEDPKNYYQRDYDLKNKTNKTNIASDRRNSEQNYTKFIDSSGTIDASPVVESTYIDSSTTINVESDLDPSTEDIIFMTTSRTPSLTLTDPHGTKLSVISVDPVYRENTTSVFGNINRTALQEMLPSKNFSSDSSTLYLPRPGIVLDDPEFKPGNHGRLKSHHAIKRPTPLSEVNHPTQHLPPGYGEIFDVTLSAIQGLSSGGGSSQQIIKIKPYVPSDSVNKQENRNNEIVLIPSDDEGIVSIDGKRTYINLLGEPTNQSEMISTHKIAPVASLIPDIQTENSSNTSDTRNVDFKILSTTTKLPPTSRQELSRPIYRPRTTQAPVRIDTCIVGDDSTCDQAQHEHCQTENGISSCHCRPGHSRRKHREPCRKIVSFFIALRVDRVYDHRIVWDNKLLDHSSEQYGQLGYESVRAINSAMSMTPYSDEFMEAKVNSIHRADPSQGNAGVFVNLTLKFDESVETLRPNMRSDVQKHLLGVIHRRNNNIGSSRLFVNSPEGSISHLQDVNECESADLNDCHANAECWNSWGAFQCVCKPGFRDPWADQPIRAGRTCHTCSDSYCNNHGVCSYNEGQQVCTCDSSHYGGQCEIDGEVLGVAIGASIAAVIIIVLTLVCLIMWSRKWQREQKNAIGSPMFGYINTAPLKNTAIPRTAYQVTLEDRMRWAQIADVIAQTNHYGADPVASTRPSSAMFAYPNLQNMGLEAMGGVPMQGNMQMNQPGGLPPVPLPRRLGLGPRSNGMRALENSSSSEEEDRTDLIARNFQVPRPKSRSNGSITNHSGIYYDVDYQPSGCGMGDGSSDVLYGSQSQHATAPNHPNQHHHIPGPQGIPMSTYTSGRAPSSYYVK